MTAASTSAAPAGPRSDGRTNDQLRPVRFQNHIAPNATGSTLIEWGQTRVICGVTVEESVPRWMKEQGVTGGWITAEYSMLPYSTQQRKQRDISKGKIDGRSQEIQRLIGRSLRAVTDLGALGERQVTLDCDVLQADGGTRCASITGAMVALADAVRFLKEKGLVAGEPLRDFVAAVSVGIVEGEPRLDLDYEEDSSGDTDMNVVMTGSGGFVEIQGTAEGEPFTREQMDRLLALATRGIGELVAAQKRALAG